ncbi:Mysoin-binding motif of peroxisomes-domain-containing protein [Lineolata rhizophorae]|uniref:Vezatin n=1 Tax=Lineolata rhizophorae TaxID=578093 RepID=A0A6A6NN58_9PEZI|nr:Mysoin-binding motif of peroxisomes-domain-containing protein [Lineolata rhizophorae]
MENVIYEDTPLAAYLEGEGKAESTSAPTVDWNTVPQDSPGASPKTQQSFAPRGPSTLQSRIKGKLPAPLRVKVPAHGPVARIHTACSRAVNSRLGRADNARFLEHFRYILITSQLLSERDSAGGLLAPTATSAVSGSFQAPEFKATTITVTGASVTAASGLVLAWLIHWARDAETSGLSGGRVSLVTLMVVAVTAVFYGYVRRQWLQHLRQQAVDAASALVTNIQAFDASTSAALTLIQEVELVSRGYRISSPLPPISRLEEKGQGRRCARLRKSLRNAFVSAIPSVTEAFNSLKPLVLEDDFEKYLDVYDITKSDLHEGLLGCSESESEDLEALKILRIYQFRLSILRRVFLCSLLALEADGGKLDFARWREAVHAMETVASIMGKHSEKLNNILTEEEQFTLPPTPKAPVTPGRARVRSQIRKLGSLSQGIRGLQAKLQILREESAKSLDGSSSGGGGGGGLAEPTSPPSAGGSPPDADVSDAAAHLMAQYDSIGADLRALLQAWETGRASLALNVDRATSSGTDALFQRRASAASRSSSAGLRSPVPSLGGLTAVDELSAGAGVGAGNGSGSPSDALRALNGEATGAASGSSVENSAGGSGASSSDEEIFEAMAIPKTRGPGLFQLSREERVAKVAEDRARQAARREQREASSNMLRELQSVIELRPGAKRAHGQRVTSL